MPGSQAPDTNTGEQQAQIPAPRTHHDGARPKTSPGMPPLRDPDEKSDPVELLLDITFVALLNQASSLLFRDAGASGMLDALAVLLVALLFWQMTAGATGIIPVDGVMRVLYLAKTGAFLLMAASVQQAFGHANGGTGMPWLFAAATSVAGICSIGMWAYLGSRDRRWWGNAAHLVGFAVVLSASAWAAELIPGGHASRWLLIGYAVAMALISNTGLPFPAKFGFGSRVPHWAIHGARAYRERYTTSYVVGCCLCLQLLERVGESAWAKEELPPSALLLVAVALNVSCMMYWLYEPLVEPARRVVDPRNPGLSKTRQVAHSLGDVYGHMLMFAGMVLAAAALRAMLTALDAAHEHFFGPAVDTANLVELFGGIALCLLGQAMFYSFTSWRLDPIRLGAVVGMLALIPLLRGHSVLAVIFVLPFAVAAAYILDRRRRARQATAQQATAAKPSRVRRYWPRFRRWVLPTDQDHQVSGFELFFDFMAAFAFAQVGNVAMRNPSVSGGLHALLILGSIYGCWLTYCWAANNARADSGALRHLHVTALFSLILLSLTLPGAFGDNGLNAHVLLFLAAYLIIRLASAAALVCLFGRGARRRAALIVGFGGSAAVCIAVAVHLGGAAGTVLWAVAVCCEIVAIAASATGMGVKAPAHLAERFAFLVILGLDMSLSGVCSKFADTEIGGVHVALIVAALLVCTLMWWLYFDSLTHYAEHRLQHGPDHRPHRHRRFVHLHYNLLHLVILAGMVSVGLALRSIGDTTAHEATSLLGPELTPLTAVCLTVGLAAYLVGITTMWSVLHRPTVVPWLIAAAALAVTPWLVHRPAIEALGILITVIGVPVVGHALTPAIRAHRHSIRHETHHAPAH